MTAQSIAGVAESLNEHSREYRIGQLQTIRALLNPPKRRSGTKIFSSQTIFEVNGYAFHHGGRTELQFNIGRDGSDFRHGVAFSLELSQSLRSLDELEPKVRLFNDFLGAGAAQLADMRGWHWLGPWRSEDSMPAPIPPEIVRPGYFIFLGKHYPPESIDLGAILRDFDRLLPLYEYIESCGQIDATPPLESGRFEFRPGCPVRRRSAAVSRSELELDADLRHCEMQLQLYTRLTEEFGAASVAVEQPTAGGTFIDLVVKRPDGYWFYEIKTAASPRLCIREAISQLLEYSLWPGAQLAEKLIIVGEPALDAAAGVYLRRLREDFNLPAYYEQLRLAR